MADNLFETVEPSFPEFWMRYPRKVAKAAAEKAYQKAVKTSPHAAIMASLDFMLATEWKGRDREFLPHASTFLNREKFEGDPRESYQIHSDAVTAAEEIRPGEHFCKACETPHWWKHECEVWCKYQKYHTCPEVIEATKAEIRAARLRNHA